MGFSSKDISAYMARMGRGVAAPASKPRREKIDGKYDSKLERDYALRLDLLVAAGEVEWWMHHPWKFPLGRGRVMTPDFLVWYPDGTRELHEVKGYMWDRDRYRIEWFRDKYPGIALVVVTRPDKRAGWQFEKG